MIRSTVPKQRPGVDIKQKPHQAPLRGYTKRKKKEHQGKQSVETSVKSREPTSSGAPLAGWVRSPSRHLGVLGAFLANLVVRIFLCAGSFPQIPDELFLSPSIAVHRWLNCFSFSAGEVSMGTGNGRDLCSKEKAEKNISQRWTAINSDVKAKKNSPVLQGLLSLFAVIRGFRFHCLEAA